jgi:deoxyadenosine kinase
MTQSDFDRDRAIFAGIAGIISAGKSTLTRQLAAAIGAEAYYEPVKDNEYLDDFYEDKAKYGFAMQIYLLNRRFGQHEKAIWTLDADGKSAVQDRTIYEDSIFAEMLCEAGLMDKRDFRTYLGLFKKMSNFLQKPDVILYLVVRPETAMQRMIDRGRKSEKIGVSLDYLKSLEEHYERWFEQMTRPPRALNIVRVPWDEHRIIRKSESSKEDPEIRSEDIETLVRIVENATSTVRKDAARWGRKY